MVSKIKLNLKNLDTKTLALICITIIAVTWISASSALQPPSFDLEAEMVYDALQTEIGSSVSALEKSASFIIGQVGSYTYVLNGTNGRLWNYSTDANTVISLALDGLTDGRTWKERVILKGTFEITDSSPVPLQLAGYTIFDLRQAKIIDNRSQTDAGKWENLIENEHPNAGDSHIEILGGIIDGQRGSVWFQDEEGAGYGSTGNGILWINVSQSQVVGTTFLNCAGNAVGTVDTANNSYRNLYAENCVGYGQFEQTGEENSEWVFCTAVNSV